MESDRQRLQAQGDAPTFSPQHSETGPHRTVHQPQPSPSHHHAHSHSSYTPALAPEPQPYVAVPALATKLPGPPEVPRRRPSTDQVYAAHRETRIEAKQALKEEPHTEGLLKSRKAVLPSEIRKREKSVDDSPRGRHDEMEWQSYSPEWRRMSRGEEDWDKGRTRERGRERHVERRERGNDYPANIEKQEDRVYRSMLPQASVQPQARQHRTLEQPYQQEQMLLRQQIEPQRRQHIAQPHEDLRLPQQREQDYKPQRQELTYQIAAPQEPPRKELKMVEEIAHKHRQQAQQEASVDSEVFLQKGSSLPQPKLRSLDLKPKVRTRSMSDIGISQASAMYHMERAAGANREASAMANGELGTLDTRVSVAQLRHSYLENANRKPEL